MAANVCQHWSIDSNGDPIEPGLCPNWDVANAICTFTEKITNAVGDEVEDTDGNPVEVKDEDGNPIRASFYPHCNLVGTQAQCNQYAGTGTQKRCIAPDHSRHVVNRRTGKKWAIKSVIEEGEVTTPADYSAITEYNNGDCDGFGTATKCAAYSSYIMGFSSLQPDDKDGTKKADEDGVFTTISGFDVRLPLSHEVYNKRADLGRCYWWQADNEDFTAESSLDSENFGKVNTVTFRCTNTDEIVNNYSGDVGNGFKWDFDLHMHRSPCNGAKPECPRYTSGICWQYCIDEKMRLGDKVLAEQILELRYHIRKEKWVPQKFKDSFIEPDLQAWDGTVTVKSDNKYLIPVHRTYINDFDTFEIKRDKAMLTEGTAADDYREKYPDLVRELKDIVLAPIIRNRFDNTDIHGEELSSNIFESSDINHASVLVFGDIFWYNSETYAFNLDDPELNFPSHVAERLKEHINMAEIEAKLELDSEAVFDEFYKELECILDFMMDAMPDKMPSSEFGSTQNMFYIDAPTRWGDNTIFVFNKGSGRWEYDSIYFKKIYVGGVIGQTSFSLSGSGEIDYLPDYGEDFSAYLNDNGSVSFDFFPLVSEEHGDYGNYLLNYTYLDGVRDRLAPNPAIVPDNNTYEMTYKLYKITVGASSEESSVTTEIRLDIENVKFFGNAGYALSVIPDEVDTDKTLSYVIKPWEVEGKLEIVHVDDDGNETGREEMIIYEHCNDRMEVNQFIIKPKDINNFTPFCKNDYLSIERLVTYERRTLETPDFWWDVELEEFIDEDDTVTYRESFNISATDNSYTIRKFGYEPLMASVVFRGIGGRIKGHVKTKLITWVRQPFCRDVEIKYAWNAGYEYGKLLPEYNCYVREGDQAGKSIEPDPRYIGYTPPCGDHDISFRTETGPMWYPYDDCDSYARYNITGNLSEWDIRIMEVFWEGWADPPHDSQDIRMLGPADSFGETCDTHASLWNCLCDWSYCNSTKTTENLFSGYGRYRGGVTGLNMQKMLQNDGTPPKFGNTYRDFVRSYRSMDNIDYYAVEGTSFVRRRKWVPMNEFYASADITNPTSSYPYLMYCSNDFYDDTSSFMHQFGFLMVVGDIEGVEIAENMEMAALVPKRYDFDEVFRTHSSLSGLYYPFPKDPYYRLINSILVPIITWYTYKDYPEGDLSKSIQWAWQELWGELERYSLDTSDRTCASYTYIGDHPTITDSTLTEEKLVTLQRRFGDDIIGRHIYFNVEHPDYKYDYTLAEHRLVCDEDDQVLWLTAPGIVEGIGNYGDDPIWGIKLNSGPERCFDLDGVWADGAGCNKTLYDTCTQSPWVTEVTLFDTGFTSTTPDVDRTITTYDDVGDEVLEYYQRGLSVTTRSEMMKYLPRSIVLLNSEDYEIRLNKLADCMAANAESEWAFIEDLTQFYPAEYNLDLMYCDDSNELTIDMKFVNTMTIGAVSIDFGLGAFGEEGDIAGLIFLGDLYHLPGITIYKSDDGVSFTEISKLDSMFLSGRQDELRSVRGFYEVGFDIDDIKNPYQYIRIKLRLEPTAEEIAAKGDLSNYYDLSGIVNQVHIKNVYVYYNRFEDSTEDITTWERKYNISVGKHGDFPPHGTDSTGSLFYSTPIDKSTAYQYDTIGGVVGMPGSAGKVNTMNKSRGRILFETHSDKEPLEIGVGGGVSWLYKAEEEQKNVYDAIVNEGETSFSFTSVVPPSLDSKLLEIGVTFPYWRCSFDNSVVRPLKSVEKKGVYSPCGHLFIADYKNLEEIKNCGRHGSIFWRSTEDVFTYVFQHACTGELNWSIDVFTAWESGIGAVLINPMGYIGPGLSQSEEIAASINTSKLGDVTMQLGNPVGSLN